MDFDKLSHVLLICGWIPVEKNSFKKITETMVSFNTDERKSRGEGENKKIVTKYDNIIAFKFEK